MIHNVGMAAALSLGLAIILIQMPSASATVVQFNYSGLDSETAAGAAGRETARSDDIGCTRQTIEKYRRGRNQVTETPGSGGGRDQIGH